MIDVSAPVKRAALVVPVLLALLGCWYSVRWYMGNEIALVAPDMEQGSVETARSGMRLAPDDPWTHWMVANLERKDLAPENLAEAVRQYEEAVRLSPNDFRWWMDLGRARDQAGDREGGEKALRRAVELAPSYFYPRWYLGNLLLRAGRESEAFQELRRAGDADPAQRPQIFHLAWYFYSEDVQKFKDAVGDSGAARAQLVSYLAGRQRLDDALKVWSSLNQAEKKEQRTTGESLMKLLLASKRYQAALGVFRETFPELASGAEAGQFLNGGFESDVTSSSTNPFAWQIKSVPQARIALDPRNRQEGARSLRVDFNSPSVLAFRNISQLIVVEPDSDYRLEYYVRTNDLKSAGLPLIEVINPSDESVVAASEPASAGENDWRPVIINFNTSSGMEAVMVRVNRASCGADAVCPIFGTVWYDNFNLQRAAGRRNSVSASSSSSSGNKQTRSTR